jgi:hypothetical protein
MKRMIGILTLCGTVVWSSPLPAGKTSTLEGRKRAVETARQLEGDPLGPGAEERRAELLKWWTGVSDLPLTWCANMLAGELKDTDKSLAGAISLQAPFSAGAAMIEHPEIAKDKRAFAIAGLEGALRAYQAVVSKDPSKRSLFLEGLSKEGALGPYVESKLPSCR